MEHEIDKNASTAGLKKIWVFDEFLDVDEEERDHYHVDCKDHPGFVVPKRFLQVDIYGNGIYDGKDDFSGRMIYRDKDDTFLKKMFHLFS